MADESEIIQTCTTQGVKDLMEIHYQEFDKMEHTLGKLRAENERLSAANERLRKENGNLRVMVETWRQTAYEHGYEDR